MGKKKKAREQQEQQERRRSVFEPRTIGVIAGVKLALWMLQKTHVIVERHIEENNLTKAEPLRTTTDDEANGGSRVIKDDRDPEIGYMVARLNMTAFAMELLLKRIATIARKDGKGALHTHDLLDLWNDVPPRIRKELEASLQKRVVVKIRRPGQAKPATEAPPSIEKICAGNRKTFEWARYVCTQGNAGGANITMRVGNMNGVIPFLMNWILEKDGHEMVKLPADDAELRLEYRPTL